MDGSVDELIFGAGRYAPQPRRSQQRGPGPNPTMSSGRVPLRIVYDRISPWSHMMNPAPQGKV